MREAVTHGSQKKAQFQSTHVQRQNLKEDTFSNISIDHIKVLVVGKSNTFDV